MDLVESLRELKRRYDGYTDVFEAFKFIKEKPGNDEERESEMKQIKEVSYKMLKQMHKEKHAMGELQGLAAGLSLQDLIFYRCEKYRIEKEGGWNDKRFSKERLRSLREFCRTFNMPNIPFVIKKNCSINPEMLKKTIETFLTNLHRVSRKLSDCDHGIEDDKKTTMTMTTVNKMEQKEEPKKPQPQQQQQQQSDFTVKQSAFGKNKHFSNLSIYVEQLIHLFYMVPVSDEILFRMASMLYRVKELHHKDCRLGVSRISAISASERGNSTLLSSFRKRTSEFIGLMLKQKAFVFLMRNFLIRTLSPWGSKEFTMTKLYYYDGEEFGKDGKMLDMLFFQETDKFEGGNIVWDRICRRITRPFYEMLSNYDRLGASVSEIMEKENKKGQESLTDVEYMFMEYVKLFTVSFWFSVYRDYKKWLGEFVVDCFNADSKVIKDISSGFGKDPVIVRYQPYCHGVFFERVLHVGTIDRVICRWFELVCSKSVNPKKINCTVNGKTVSMTMEKEYFMDTGLSVDTSRSGIRSRNRTLIRAAIRNGKRKIEKTTTTATATTTTSAKTTSEKRDTHSENKNIYKTVAKSGDKQSKKEFDEWVSANFNVVAKTLR